MLNDYKLLNLQKFNLDNKIAPLKVTPTTQVNILLYNIRLLLLLFWLL